MLKLISFLLSGCWHKWTTEKTVTLTNTDGSVGTRVYLKCEHCGDWKKRDLI